MTRINVVDPRELTDQHLLAEYRELPRVFALARPGVKVPERYTLGKGHVLFFYPRTGWLSKRQAELIAECQHRGFAIQHTTPPAPVAGCEGDWNPPPEAWWLNKCRLRERLAQRPGWYTLHGRPVEPTFYGVDLDLLAMRKLVDGEAGMMSLASKMGTGSWEAERIYLEALQAEEGAKFRPPCEGCGFFNWNHPTKGVPEGAPCPHCRPRKGHSWGKLLNEWHDEVGPFHLLRDDGSPRCGVPYRSSTGAYPYEEKDCHPRCGRCEAIDKTDERGRESQKARDPKCRTCGYPRWGCGCISFDAPAPDFTTPVSVPHPEVAQLATAPRPRWNTGDPVAAKKAARELYSNPDQSKVLDAIEHATSLVFLAEVESWERGTRGRVTVHRHLLRRRAELEGPRYVPRSAPRGKWGVWDQRDRYMLGKWDGGLSTARFDTEAEAAQAAARCETYADEV